jgi:hypothetical protein
LQGSVVDVRAAKRDVIGKGAAPSSAGLEATACEGIVLDHGISVTETRLLETVNHLWPATRSFWTYHRLTS